MQISRLGAVLILVAVVVAGFWIGRGPSAEDGCVEMRALWSRLESEADQAESDVHAANAYLERPYFTDSWRAEIAYRRDRSEQQLVDLQVQASVLMRHQPDCFSPAELMGA